MSLVVVELLVPPHLTNSFSDLADFLHYLVRHHFLNLLGYPQLPQLHLVHLLVRSLHQAAIVPQFVTTPLLFALAHLTQKSACASVLLIATSRELLNCQ